MAVLYYKVYFSSEATDDTLLYIFRKTGTMPNPLNFAATSMQINVRADNGKMDTIFFRELVVSVHIDFGVIDLTWKSFLDAKQDTYMGICTRNGHYDFHGFLIPEETKTDFQDPPYDLVLRFSDGLGFLEFEPLTDFEAPAFNNRHTLIEYIAGALKKTLLDLPIRIYCNIYHASMTDRADDIKWDMFSQAMLHHRTFLKEVDQFDDCLTVLIKIFTQNFRLFYWDGRWVIMHYAEFQKLAGSPDENLYYSDYDKDGVLLGGGLDVEGRTPFGKNVDLYPILEDQLIWASLAAKSVRTFYRYIVPPDLVNNEKLQRFGDLLIPLSGVDHSAFELVGWEQLEGRLTDQQPYTGGYKAYILKTFDAFLIETDRYYVIEFDPSIPGNTTQIQHYITHTNDDFFVVEDDKLTFSFDWRWKNRQFGVSNGIYVCRFALLKEGTDGTHNNDWWSMDKDGVWWDNTGNSDTTTILYGEAPFLLQKWKTVSISTTIPANGQIYVQFGSGADGDDFTGNSIYIKNISFGYDPYIKGSDSSLKGDQWKRTNADTYPDTIESEVFLSDGSRKIMKGAIWNPNGDILTTPEWYRYGVTESRQYKDLVNMAQYNFYYRRYWGLEGTWNGIDYAPEFDQTNRQPLAFHKLYYTTDFTTHSGGVYHHFILISAGMDLITGQSRLEWAEVYETTADGTQVGATAVFSYNFS